LPLAATDLSEALERLLKELIGRSRLALLRHAEIFDGDGRLLLGFGIFGRDLEQLVDKIRRLPWALGREFSSLAERPARLEPPPEFPRGKVILTVGRWASSERYKGVDDLIRAVAQLHSVIPDLHLVAVGDGDDLRRLQNLATETKTNDFVHFLQGLSREKLAACYARSDVFALPSTGEGFGLVFLEAMAFGVPIVAAAAGGSTDLVENEINGLLVSPHDPEQLARALRRLLCDDALRSRLGRQGMEKVRNQYSFGRFASELDEILSTLA